MATKPMRGPAGRAMHATERPKNTGKTMRRTMASVSYTHLTLPTNSLV